MNIRGYERLIEMKFLVSRKTALFRTLDDIPAGHMDAYGDEPKWFMAGFDYEKNRITDNPYMLYQIRAVGFSRRDLNRVFRQLEKELESKGVSPQDRMYLVWELHSPDNTDFTGFGFKGNYEIKVDFFDGVRPSRRDANPSFSVNIPTIGLSEINQIPEVVYKNSAIRIARDLMILPDNTSVDFVCLKDGYLFYSDLWQLA